MNDNNKRISSDNRHISVEEIARQRQITQYIKQHYAQLGKQPMAMVQTYGCQQNENDSERIRGMLFEAGYGFCEDVCEADIIIFNTCAVRENAEFKVFGNLGALTHEKRRRPGLIIGVCGCMMQQEHIVEDIKKKYRHVDIIFGTHTLYTLPQMIWQVMNSSKRSINILDIDGQIAENIPIRREGSVKAYVSIMYGCNNFCSYCIVPYVRGRERSRRALDILSEIRKIASEGYKEVMLLGQNVNSYGKDSHGEMDFSELILAVAKIDGIERIRFMTSHPKDFDDKLIEAMASCKKICAQLHLPIQSGSDSVLADMNRKYTTVQYLEKIEKMRKAIPNIAITSDIIVGFPTETNEDVNKTIELLEKVRFDIIYSYIYSKRTGTPAANMPSVLSDDDIHKNFDRLINVQNKISRQINESYLGGVYDVLVEGESKTDASVMTGRTSCAKVVNFVGSHGLIGRIVPIKITAANTWSLKGELDVL